MSLADIAKEASEFSKKLLYELFGDDVDTGQAERKEGDPKWQPANRRRNR